MMEKVSEVQYECVFVVHLRQNSSDVSYVYITLSNSKMYVKMMMISLS